MSLFCYLITFASNLQHRKFVTADVTAVFVNNQHGTYYLATRTVYWLKRLYSKRHTAKRLIDEFPEKSWTKCGVIKVLKKLWDTCTVDT